MLPGTLRAMCACVPALARETSTAWIPCLRRHLGISSKVIINLEVGDKLFEEPIKRSKDYGNFFKPREDGFVGLNKSCLKSGTSLEVEDADSVGGLISGAGGSSVKGEDSPSSSFSARLASPRLAPVS